MKAYRQDFVAITALMTDGNPARLTVADITKDSMRQAFAAYAVNTKLYRSGAAGPPGTCCALCRPVSGVGAELLRPQLVPAFKQSTHCVRHVFVWSNQRRRSASRGGAGEPSTARP